MEKKKIKNPSTDTKYSPNLRIQYDFVIVLFSEQ